MNIILSGYKNSGKTTIGMHIAKKFSYNFIDIDKLIIKYAINLDLIPNHENNKTNMNLISIAYKKLGDKKFRAIESLVVAQLNQNINNDNPSAKINIISIGGGTILDNDNYSSLKELGTIIYIDAPPKDLFKRIDKNNIPIIYSEQKNNMPGNKLYNQFFQHYSSRVNAYNKTADLTIKTANKSLDSICNEINNYALKTIDSNTNTNKEYIDILDNTESTT